MTDVLDAVIRGLSFGSVYALLAVSLVLTYRTTGIFNLAFGPQAFLVGRGLLRHARHASLADAGRARVLGRDRRRRSSGILLDRGLFRFLRTRERDDEARVGARLVRRASRT